MLKQIAVKLSTEDIIIFREKMRIFGLYNLDELLITCNKIAKIKGREDFHKFIEYHNNCEKLHTTNYRIKEETLKEIEETIKSFGMKKCKNLYYCYLGFIIVQSRNVFSELKHLEGNN